MTEVPRKAPLAPGSGLEWTADDNRLIVALRSPEQDRAAAERFKALTDGPIIVQSSKDPFLDWDALQRATRTRAIASLDPVTGETATILPDRKISSYRVTRDSRLVTFMEDVTEKTDYDTIGGTLNALRAVDVSGQAAVRTIAAAKDLKDVQLRWSDDGRIFAYAKKGEVFVQNVDEAKPRSLPQPKTEDGKAEDGRRKKGRPRRKEEGGARVFLGWRVQPRRVEAAHHEQEGLVRRHRRRCGQDTGADARSRPGRQVAEARGARVGARRQFDLRDVFRPGQVGARRDAAAWTADGPAASVLEPLTGMASEAGASTAARRRHLRIQPRTATIRRVSTRRQDQERPQTDRRQRVHGGCLGAAVRNGRARDADGKERTASFAIR